MYNFEELHIPLPDRYSAYARYWSADPCRGAVLMLHGIQSHCGWFEQSASRLQQAGFAVLQPDRRGSGRNPEARGHAASPHQIIEDAFSCMDVLSRRSGVKQPSLVGISWGGKLAVAMHVVEPERVAALYLIAPGLFPVIDVSPAEKFRIGCAMVANPGKHFDIPLNNPDLFTSDPDWQRYLREDPFQIHQATASFFLASRRMDRTVQTLAKGRPVPVHLFLAADERIIDNERTSAFIRDLGWPNWSITRYERSRHTLEFDPDRELFCTDLVARVTKPYSSGI